MLQSGRKSSANLAVISEPAHALQRVAPSACLTDEQRRIWLETVNSRPADWFGREQIPLLEGLCRHAANASVIAQEIDGIEPESLKDDEGLRRYERLLALHEREVRAMSSLATRLRLTNQAVTDDETFGRKGRRNVSVKPWETAAE